MNSILTDKVLDIFQHYLREVLGKLSGRAKHFKFPGNPKSII